MKEELSPDYYTLREHFNKSWLKVGAGVLSLRGRDSLFSTYNQSIIAKKITDFNVRAEAELHFSPENFMQMAGLTCYYNNNNFYYLRLYYSQSLESKCLGILIARITSYNVCYTKLLRNLGTSKDCLDLDVEMAKVKAAVDMGAEAIMDLSSFGDTQKFRRKLTAECPACLGTVPIYDAVVYYNKALKKITSKEWIDIVRMHAEDGVDFMTIHCGINKNTAQRFKNAKRHTNIVSRGGSIIFAWMELTGNENSYNFV